MVAAPDPKKQYNKAFLDALDAALVLAATDNQPSVVIYRRQGKLDVRVKVECRTPTTETPTSVILES